MRISPKDTIEDVITKNAALFTIGFDRICEKVKTLDVPKYIPLIRSNKKPQNIECRDTLPTLTMRELDMLSQVEPSLDYVFGVLSTMLRIDEDQVPKLQFLGALRYYIQVLEDISAISKMWKKLEVHDEDAITPDHPDRGVWAVVDEYSDDKKITMDKAWDALCMDVYLHIEKNHDRYMAQKARIEAQRRINNGSKRNYR